MNSVFNKSFWLSRKLSLELPWHRPQHEDKGVQYTSVPLCQGRGYQSDQRLQYGDELKDIKNSCISPETCEVRHCSAMKITDRWNSKFQSLGRNKREYERPHEGSHLSIASRNFPCSRSKTDYITTYKPGFLNKRVTSTCDRQIICMSKKQKKKGKNKMDITGTPFHMTFADLRQNNLGSKLTRSS